jgi:hypothetical protein
LFEFLGFADASDRLDVFVFVSSSNFVGVSSGFGFDPFAATASSTFIAARKPTRSGAAVEFGNVGAPKFR